MDYEIMIIGGGPGGYVAAIKAAQLGKKTCLIEKDAFGGTCLNIGCIPTKVLLKSVGVFNQVKAAETFGITGIPQDKIGIDLGLVQQRKKGIVNALVGGVSGLLKKNGVAVYKGEAKFIDKNTVMAGNKKITAENIIIATGSETKMLPLDNPAKMPIYTSTEILDMTELPKSIAIIGGGVIGTELAFYLAGVGVKVSIVEFLPRLLPPVDKEITDRASKKLEALGVEIYTSAAAKSLQKNKLIFEKDGKSQEVKCDAVLMAVGRSARTAGLGAENIGIRFDNGNIEANEYLQTNIENIYAIGDVNGKMMLAHTASMEGIIAVENICGKKTKMRYDTIPSCIYLSPEIASVGLTEEQAKEKYGDIKVGVFPMLANGKSKIEGEETGIIKVIATPKYNEIVGVHMYCYHATDMIVQMVLAMNLECTTDELANTIHPHPTISEAVHEACHAALHKAIHF